MLQMFQTFKKDELGGWRVTAVALNDVLEVRNPPNDVWHVPGTSDNLHIHPNVVKILWSQLSGDGQLASITLWQTNITMENHYFNG